MKNKQLWIIVLALGLIVVSLFFYGKVQSSFPEYLRITKDKRLIELSINHLFSGSKKTEKPKNSLFINNNYQSCIDQSNGNVNCTSYCPGGNQSGQYCPPANAYINAYSEEGKGSRDIIVTNHSYYFNYAMSRIFGFGQYPESGILTSNTEKFKAPRVIAFLDPNNVKKSDKISWCNGTIRIERALLGYAKSKNTNGSTRIDTNVPAVYFYVSRYIYPQDKSKQPQKCINFGLPIDIVEPNLEAVKTYLPNNFDNSKILYYFLDLQEYPN